MARTLHVAMAIRTDFVRWKRKKDRDGYRKTFTDSDGNHPTESDLLAYLRSEEAKGRKVLPMGCPTPNPGGTCPGHDCEDEKEPTK